MKPKRLLEKWLLKRKRIRLQGLIQNMLKKCPSKKDNLLNKIDRDRKILKEKMIWRSKLLVNFLILIMKWHTICFKIKIGITKQFETISWAKCKLNNKENHNREKKFNKWCRHAQIFIILMKLEIIL